MSSREDAIGRPIQSCSENKQKKANPSAQVKFCGPLGGFGLRVSLARLLATGSDQRLVGGWAAFFSLTLLHADGSVSVHQRQSKPPDDHLLA